MTFWSRHEPKGGSGPTSEAKLQKLLGCSGYEDRCMGSLLGCACGDMLGANFEFKSRLDILRDHGQLTAAILPSWNASGRFTDDTEMTLALATSLLECGGIDPQHCARTYATFFSAEPYRGYGPAVSEVLTFLGRGGDYRSSGRLVYPEGSFANGGSMRIAPVGLAFRHAEPSVLHQAVQAALLCTHVHPDAVDGAFVQAVAIRNLALLENVAAFEVDAFVSKLGLLARGVVLKDKLALVRAALEEDWSAEKLLLAICTSNEYGKQFQIHAAEAVCCAFWAFLRNFRQPERCVVEAIGLGGDTDTVAAMTGALAGALHGTGWIPKLWYDHMENEAGIGRDYLIETARKLATLDLSSV